MIRTVLVLAGGALAIRGRRAGIAMLGDETLQRNRRQRAAPVDDRQGLAGQLLDRPQQGALVGRAERNGDAFLARARRAADAVHVSLGHFRQVEVHHVADVVDVDAAGGDVGGDENGGLALLEVVEGALALVLALVAVDGGRGDAGGLNVLGDAIRPALGAREDDRAREAGTAQQFGEQRRLAAGLDQEDFLRDTLGGRGDGGHLDLDRVAQHLRRQRGDLARHGRREEQALARLRQLLQDLADRHDEAEVEHVIGLVEHENLGLVQLHGARRHVVEQAAGGRHENIEAARHGLRLRAGADAADDDGDANAGEAPIGAKARGDLGGQFARRSEDQRARRLRGGPLRIEQEAVDDRQREGRGLAGARLCDAEQILVLQQRRNGLGLDRRGGRVAFLRQGAKKGLGEAEVRELSHKNTFECPTSGIRAPGRGWDRPA